MSAGADAALRISTDPAEIEFERVHAWLRDESYWCHGLPRAVLEKAVAHSLCFSAFAGARQVGFARVVTDRATFAYLCDVFVFPDARGRGVSKALMAAIDAHPDLQWLRRFILATADAHGLYARHGFTPLVRPERFMERYRPDVYLGAG